MQKREVSLSEKCEKSLKSGQTAVHILCLFTVLLHTDYLHGFGFSGQTAQATKTYGTYSESMKMGLFDDPHLLIVGRLYNVPGPPKEKVP